MKVVFEDLTINPVSDDLTEEQVRAVLVGARPAAANAVATVSYDADGKVMTFVGKSAEKGC